MAGNRISMVKAAAGSVMFWHKTFMICNRGFAAVSRQPGCGVADVSLNCSSKSSMCPIVLDKRSMMPRCAAESGVR